MSKYSIVVVVKKGATQKNPFDNSPQATPLKTTWTLGSFKPAGPFPSKNLLATGDKLLSLGVPEGGFLNFLSPENFKRGNTNIWGLSGLGSSAGLESSPSFVPSPSVESSPSSRNQSLSPTPLLITPPTAVPVPPIIPPPSSGVLPPDSPYVSDPFLLMPHEAELVDSVYDRVRDAHPDALALAGQLFVTKGDFIDQVMSLFALVILGEENPAVRSMAQALVVTLGRTFEAGFMAMKLCDEVRVIPIWCSFVVRVAPNCPIVFRSTNDHPQLYGECSVCPR